MENAKNNEGNGSKCRPVGRWTIEIKKCTGCGDCVDVCIRHLLKIENRRVNIINETLCNQCGDCERACAYYAIELT